MPCTGTQHAPLFACACILCLQTFLVSAATRAHCTCTCRQPGGRHPLLLSSIRAGARRRVHVGHAGESQHKSQCKAGRIAPRGMSCTAAASEANGPLAPRRPACQVVRRTRAAAAAAGGATCSLDMLPCSRFSPAPCSCSTSTAWWVWLQLKFTVVGWCRSVLVGKQLGWGSVRAGGAGRVGRPLLRQLAHHLPRFPAHE